MMLLAARAIGGDTTLERMPADLEERFALSALPAAMRTHATVYLLDPAKGYRVARQGTSGVACLVQRTEWETPDYRNDLYVPRCYDAAGARTYMKVLMDAASLRARGMSPAGLKMEVVRRYRNGRYAPPAKSGLSYMLGPVMRTHLPDGSVRTFSGPHVMFYAPNVTNADIGAIPESTSVHPFALQEGLPQQSYILQMMGVTERATVMADEHELVAALCSYREVLCLPGK